MGGGILVDLRKYIYFKLKPFLYDNCPKGPYFTGSVMIYRPPLCRGCSDVLPIVYVYNSTIKRLRIENIYNPENLLGENGF